MDQRLRPGSFTACVVAALLFCAVANSQAADEGSALIERLSHTRVLNMDSILAGQFEGPDPAPGTIVRDPYLAEHLDIVLASAAANQAAVCAVRFDTPERVEYHLANFDTEDQAAESGYTMTHHGRCGTCSTLRDLAVYLGRPDLTTPARKCARKRGFSRTRQCFIEELGFTEACATSWAFNARNTRRVCRSACIETYGLFNLLLHRYPAPNNRDDGSLNACLQCDEDLSGPGFRYSAGRTRRNSGILSAIQRPDDSVIEVDHARYFAR